MDEKQEEASVSSGLKLVRALRGHTAKPPIIPEAERAIFAQQENRERAEVAQNSKVGIVAIGCLAAFLLLCCGSCSLWAKVPSESKFSWPRR